MESVSRGEDDAASHDEDEEFEEESDEDNERHRNLLVSSFCLVIPFACVLFNLMLQLLYIDHHI